MYPSLFLLPQVIGNKISNKSLVIASRNIKLHGRRKYILGSEKSLQQRARADATPTFKI